MSDRLQLEESFLLACQLRKIAHHVWQGMTAGAQGSWVSTGRKQREMMLLVNSSPLLVQFGIPASETVVPTLKIGGGGGGGRFPTVKSF